MYHDTFHQDPPHIFNPYLSDTTLQDILETWLPSEVLKAIKIPLQQFGYRCITEVKELGEQCEKNPPKLHQYDAWQNRVDKIETCEAWKKLHDISAEEGLIRIGYKRNIKDKYSFGKYARLIQFAKVFLFDSNCNIYDCPLAMTDGAARLIDALLLHDSSKLSQNVRSQLQQVFEHLTSTNPEHFWTSGQWMTEKAGGSDVSGGTQTIAVPSKSPEPWGDYELHGVKFFTSSTDSNMSFALARIVQSTHQTSNLDKIPLSLFLVRMRDPNSGKLNNIQVHRLKKKLGTNPVPTAELTLYGTRALLVGSPGQGVKNISYMLNITRTWNAVVASSYMRRAVDLARDYSTRRVVFGKKLCDIPLHSRTLARLEAEVRACMHLTFDAIRRIDELEFRELKGSSSSENDLMLRLFIPIIKLYVTKQDVASISEAMECIGGQGYMEDSGLPVLLRNAQVLTIWEGAPNVLSMDVLRVLQKHPDALKVFFKQVTLSLERNTERVGTLRGIEKTHFSNAKIIISKGLAALNTSLDTIFTQPKQDQLTLMELNARDLSTSLAHIYASSLLLNHVLDNRSSRTSVSHDIETLYIYVSTHEPLCRVSVDRNPSEVIACEKLLTLDINGSGAYGKGVDEQVFTPHSLRSSL
jgi:alkylation response protein AidB-like acyl-CoA dehydrogenase